jgi:hypothetical protein
MVRLRYSRDESRRVAWLLYCRSCKMPRWYLVIRYSFDGGSGIRCSGS